MLAISGSTLSVAIEKSARLRLQIADAAQEFRVGAGIDRLAALLQVPRVDLALQRVAPVEQRLVARRQIAHQRAEALPERRGLDAGPGNRLVVHEFVQRAGNLHAAGGHQIHSCNSSRVRRQSGSQRP